jgi:hypothetical protein
MKAERSVSKTHRILLANPPSKFSEYVFSGKFPQLFYLPRRHMGHTNFGTFEFANSIPPFFETPSTTYAVQVTYRKLPLGIG